MQFRRHHRCSFVDTIAAVSATPSPTPRRRVSGEEAEFSGGVAADRGKFCADEAVREAFGEEVAFRRGELRSESGRIVEFGDEVGEVSMVLGSVGVP